MQNHALKASVLTFSNQPNAAKADPEPASNVASISIPRKAKQSKREWIYRIKGQMVPNIEFPCPANAQGAAKHS